MLKKVISLIVFMLMFFSSSLTYADEVKNLVINPSFEDGSGINVSNWVNFGGLGQGASFEISGFTQHTGKKCLLISNFQKNDTMVMQELAIEKGKIYRISCWVKSDGIERQPGSANISLFYVSNGFDNKGIYTSKEIMNTAGKWKKIELYIKTRNDIDDPLKLALRLGGQGTPNKGRVYFDDVKVVKVDQPGKGDYFAFKDNLETTSNVTMPQENTSKQNDTSKYILYASAIMVTMIIIVAVEYLVNKNRKKH